MEPSAAPQTSESVSAPPHTFVYEYENCNKTFAEKRNLQRHAPLHGPPKYKCFVVGCGQTYTRQDKLGNHLERQHGGYLRRAMGLYCKYYLVFVILDIERAF